MIRLTGFSLNLATDSMRGHIAQIPRPPRVRRRVLNRGTGTIPIETNSVVISVTENRLRCKTFPTCSQGPQNYGERVTGTRKGSSLERHTTCPVGIDRDPISA